MGIYTVPMDVEDRLERILKLLRYASNRGDTVGILGLGFLHFKGLGVTRNLHRAMEFFQKVAGKHRSIDSESE
jgi:TPR repeat protein